MELKDLKEGEEVFYSGGLRYDYGSILKIRKITNTMIVCDNKRFRKDNGGLVGNTDKWHFPKIEVLTDELRKQVYRQRLIARVKNFNFEKLNYEEIKQIYQIIKPHTQATSKKEVVA
jgi:hypothetical protein